MRNKNHHQPITLFLFALIACLLPACTQSNKISSQSPATVDSIADGVRNSIINCIDSSVANTVLIQQEDTLFRDSLVTSCENHIKNTASFVSASLSANNYYSNALYLMLTDVATKRADSHIAPTQEQRRRVKEKTISTGRCVSDAASKKNPSLRNLSRKFPELSNKELLQALAMVCMSQSGLMQEIDLNNNFQNVFFTHFVNMLEGLARDNLVDIGK